jgi:hypothetical protein
VGGSSGSHWAPPHGSLRGLFSPISYVAALAWCPTVCRGTDDCGVHHHCTPRPRGGGASVKNPAGAREYPVCAAGWALWVTGGSPHLLYSHRGYRRVGEAFRAAASPSGPPLGAPRRCLREAKALPASPADGALGNSEGESGCAQRRARRYTLPRRAAWARGAPHSVPASQ